MSNTIVVKNISKSFGNIKALDNIDLEIMHGSIFGLLGPNGAGKSTLIRLMNGILTPDSGDVNIFNHSIKTDPIEIHKISGVLTENANIYENLSAKENLSFFAKLHCIEHNIAEKRIAKLLDFFDLVNTDSKKSKNFSTGMKKKLAIAIALLHEPQILYLDEPTSALDPEASNDLIAMISLLAKEEKRTIIISTHQLKYAESICTHYGFINNGQIKKYGDYTSLKNEFNSKIQLIIRAENIGDHPKIIKDGDKYLCEVDNEKDSSVLIKDLIASGAEIYEVYQNRISVEDLYFHYINKNGDLC